MRVFLVPVQVPADAFDSGWDGDNTAPTKDAVLDAVTPVVASNSSATYNDTATVGSKVVLHNATSAAITHNLPTAVGNKAVITIKKTDASTNTVTVDANSTETIDGGATAVLRVRYESITLVSDGSNWVII